MQKKRIMISALALVVVALVASWGVNAYFNDVENNAGNTVTAGTLDLSVNSDASNATAYMTIGNVFPGFDTATSTAADTETITLKNAGTINGILKVTVVSVTDTPGTDTEPELAALGNANPNAGDLSEFLWITINDGTTDLYDGLLTGFSGYTTDLAVGATLTLTVNFDVPTTADNQIQGDVVTFGLLFVLDQATGEEYVFTP